jgi:hypothetical protein
VSKQVSTGQFVTQMADDEQDVELRAALTQLAASYRRLVPDPQAEVKGMDN